MISRRSIIEHQQNSRHQDDERDDDELMQSKQEALRGAPNYNSNANQKSKLAGNKMSSNFQKQQQQQLNANSNMTAASSSASSKTYEDYCLDHDSAESQDLNYAYAQHGQFQQQDSSHYRHFDPYSVHGEEDEDVWYSEERLFEVSLSSSLFFRSSAINCAPASGVNSDSNSNSN